MPLTKCENKFCDFRHDGACEAGAYRPQHCPTLTRYREHVKELEDGAIIAKTNTQLPHSEICAHCKDYYADIKDGILYCPHCGRKLSPC